MSKDRYGHEPDDGPENEIRKAHKLKSLIEIPIMAAMRGGPRYSIGFDSRARHVAWPALLYSWPGLFPPLTGGGLLRAAAQG